MYTVMYKYTYIQFKTYVLGENFYLIIAGASDKYTHVWSVMYVASQCMKH